MMSAASDSQQESLDALILNATNPLAKHEDPNAVQAVVQAVCRDPSAPQTAVKILAHKIHSPQEWEAMKALSVLQACIINCGSPFHAEIGKFRFLNEMIKLVSPKYAGNHTPPAIKSRVLELLFCWMTDLTHEPKIAEAYNMLKKQGVVMEDPVYIGPLMVTPTPRPASSSIEDSERSQQLQRLLQSKRPEDLERANALIQAMVRDDQKRIERNTQCAMELEVARNNVKVLDEMLSEHEHRGGSGGELSLMCELQQTCTTLRDTLYHTIARCADTNDDISEMISVNEELTRVIGRYKVFIETRHGKSNSTESSECQSICKPDMLLDLSSPAKEKTEESVTADLVNKELSDLGLDDKVSSASMVCPASVASNSTLLQELITPSSAAPPVPLTLATPLIPQSTPVLQHSKPSLEAPSVPTPAVDSLADLDVLGSSLLKSALPSSAQLVGPTFKQPEKLSINQLKQRQVTALSTSANSAVTNKMIACVDSSNQRNTPSDVDSLCDILTSPSQDKDNMLSSSSVPVSSPDKSSVGDVLDRNGDITQSSKSNEKDEATSSEQLSINERSLSKAQFGEVKPLTDIKISIQEIKPGSREPLTLIDSGGVTTTLHHTLNSPRPQVHVFVLTTTSRCSAPLSQYVMQAVVPKGCRVRLLPPSSTSVPLYSPFLPPPAITQVMLVANPYELNVSLKVMLSYSLDGDDSITEMAEVDHLML